MDQYDYPALEGGWGWMVVLSGFSIHVLTRGCLFSTGILFAEWSSYFDNTTSETAWIGSIATGSALMIGPFASKMVEKFGYRRTSIVGGLLSFVGLFASSWANSVLTLCFTYGVLAGTGMGISYLCGVVAVGEYFDRRRSIAFGIASSGAGFGAAVMAILQQTLIDEYGWRGSLIILAGLSGLNQIVFGALLRPLSSSINWKSDERKAVLKNRINSTDTQHLNAGRPKRPESGSSWSVFPTSVNELLDELDATDAASRPSSPRLRAAAMSPSLLLRRKQLLALETINHDSKLEGYDPDMHTGIEIVLNDADEDCDVQYFNSSSASIPASSNHLKITSSDAIYLSTLSIASSRRAAEKISKTRTNCEEPDYNISNESVLYRETDGRLYEGNKILVSDAIQNRNTGVLCNSSFLILAINQFFTGLGIMIPFVHLSQKAILMGFSSKQAAYLISVIGIGNTVGKVTLGIICDMRWSNPVVVFITTQFFLAVSVAIYPIASAYGILVASSVLFGFFYGNYCAIPNLVVKFVGLNNLAEAIGYINFLEGAAGMIGPPLAGAIYDSSKSYNVAFAASAGFLFVSLAILVLQPLLHQKRCPCSSRPNMTDSLNRMYQRDDDIVVDYNDNTIRKGDPKIETRQ